MDYMAVFMSVFAYKALRLFIFCLSDCAPDQTTVCIYVSAQKIVQNQDLNICWIVL